MLEIIRKYSFDVNFETGKFKRTDGSEERIKLVQNDNESTKFKFNFEEEIADNTNVLVRLRQFTGYVKEYTMLIQNQEAEIILTNDILSESGSLTMSITLIGTDDEILTDTEYHSKIQVIASLEGNTEIPEQEKSVLVDLISQVNSLNQTASQLVEDTETAVTNSSTVLANAETALQNANTATSNANQAAQSANNAVTEIDNRLANKVDKVNGKDLSTNDFSNEYKQKVDTLENYDDTEINEDIEELETENIKLKQRISDLENNELINTVSGESIDIDDSANATIRNIKITGKSIQDGTPTPENPVEIQNCSGSINFKAENKNLAWNGWAEDFVERINDSYAASIITYNNRNCLNWKAYAGHQQYDKKYMFKTNFKENTQYTFVFDIFSQFRRGNLCIGYTDGTISHPEEFTINTWNRIIFVSTYNKTVKYLRGNYADGDSYIDLDTFMVLEGAYTAENITDYIAHEEQNITFPLQEGQVLAQDDYLADDGIHHNRKTIEITSENVNSLGLDCYKYAGNNCAYLGKRNLGWESAWNSQICLINKYKEITATSDVSNGKFAANFILGSLLIFDERFTSLEVAKELLIGTIIEIKQAQEIIEPYTSQQAQAWEQIKALRTYKNITHINSEDETPATLEVTYVRDLQTVINNMQAQILS